VIRPAALAVGSSRSPPPPPPRSAPPAKSTPVDTRRSPAASAPAHPATRKRRRPAGRPAGAGGPDQLQAGQTETMTQTAGDPGRHRDRRKQGRHQLPADSYGRGPGPTAYVIVKVTPPPTRPNNDGWCLPLDFHEVVKGQQFTEEKATPTTARPTRNPARPVATLAAGRRSTATCIRRPRRTADRIRPQLRRPARRGLSSDDRHRYGTEPLGCRPGRNGPAGCGRVLPARCGRDHALTVMLAGRAADRGAPRRRTHAAKPGRRHRAHQAPGPPRRHAAGKTRSAGRQTQPRVDVDRYGAAVGPTSPA